MFFENLTKNKTETKSIGGSAEIATPQRCGSNDRIVFLFSDLYRRVYFKAMRRKFSRGASEENGNKVKRNLKIAIGWI